MAVAEFEPAFSDSKSGPFMAEQCGESTLHWDLFVGTDGKYRKPGFSTS